MKSTLENRKKVLEYLYGELAETERDELEERLFVDEEFGLLMEEVESDLIDEYVRGELEFEEKRKFESKYLSNESRSEKVSIARTLQDELFAREAEPIVAVSEDESLWSKIAGFFRFSNLALAGGLAVLLLMVFVLASFWIFDQSKKVPDMAGGNNTNRDENIPKLREIPIEEETPETEEPEANSTAENDAERVNKAENGNKASGDDNSKSAPPVRTNKAERRPQQTDPKPVRQKPKVRKKTQIVEQKPAIFIASLFPPLRSSQATVLKIPVSAQTVRLRLFDNLGENFQKFIVKLNDPSGNQIWSGEIPASKKRPQKSVAVSIPADRLKPGNYEIALSGIFEDGAVEEINFFDFVVQQISGK
jgi:hypothetical protein